MINNIMVKKFDTLLESSMSRYTRGGFLVGDYVKFVKGFKKHAEYESLGSNVKELIDELNSSDKHIRVRGIHNQYPSRAPGHIENSNGNVFVVIAQDEGGGREYNYITVPSCLLDVVKQETPSLPALPDSMNLDKPVHQKYSDAEDKSEADAMYGHKEGKRSLAKKNAKLKHTNNPPNNVVSNYMFGH